MLIGMRVALIADIPPIKKPPNGGFSFSKKLTSKSALDVVAFFFMQGQVKSSILIFFVNT